MNAKRSMSHRLRRAGAVCVSAVLLVAGLVVGAGAASAARLSNAVFHGVSCVSSTWCVMVGDEFGSGSTSEAIIETWDDHVWTTRVRQAESSYKAISCVSTTHCVAVGYLRTGGMYEPVADVLDGTTWTFSVLPHVSADGTILYGISCTSATRCVAAGQDFFTGGFHATVEVLNGSTWKENLLANGGEFGSASCASSTNCVASGDVGTAGLLDSWNGSTWTRATGPGLSNTFWAGSSCPSTSFCFVAGYRSATTPMALVGRGSTWTAVAVALPSGATSGLLNGVSCRSASFCMTVGQTDKSGATGLSETWDGHALTRHAAPDPSGESGTIFEAVSCTSTTNCVAAGEATSSGTTVTAAEQWNGGAWSALAPH